MPKFGSIVLTLILGGGWILAAALAMEAPPPLETSTEPKRISDNASSVSYPKVRVNVTYPETRDVIRLEPKTVLPAAPADPETDNLDPVKSAVSGADSTPVYRGSASDSTAATTTTTTASAAGGGVSQLNNLTINPPSSSSSSAAASAGSSSYSGSGSFTSSPGSAAAAGSGISSSYASGYSSSYSYPSPSAAYSSGSSGGSSANSNPNPAANPATDSDASALVTIDEFPGSRFSANPDTPVDRGERVLSEDYHGSTDNGGAAGSSFQSLSQTPVQSALALSSPASALTSPATSYYSSESVGDTGAPTHALDPVKRLPRTLATLYGETISEDDVARELWRRRGKETFDWLVGQRILRRELREYGLTVRDDEVEEQLQRHLAGLRKAFPYLRRPDDLTRAAAGMPLEEYRDRTVWTELALRKIMRVSVRPKEEDLRRYYAEIRANFIKPERVKINQLFIPPQPSVDSGGIPTEHDWKRAERAVREAETQLRMGSSFDEVARIYGSGTADPRWVERGELLRELEGPVFSIEKGSLTTPIKTAMGYHILKVLEREDRREPAFEEVRAEVTARYEEERFIRKGGEFLELLKRRAEDAGELTIDADLADVEGLLE